MKNLLHPTRFLPVGLPTVIKLCMEPRAAYKYVNAYVGILEGLLSRNASIRLYLLPY